MRERESKRRKKRVRAKRVVLLVVTGQTWVLTEVPKVQQGDTKVGTSARQIGCKGYIRGRRVQPLTHTVRSLTFAERPARQRENGTEQV